MNGPPLDPAAIARAGPPSRWPSTHRRIQPSLLDRLTDDAPQQREEPWAGHLVSHSTLRKSVLRDLCWLFNCVSHDGALNLQPYPLVARSTLNFGLRALAGKHVSAIDWQALEKTMVTAITHFEPRILPHELQVHCMSDPRALNLHNTVRIEIKGKLSHSPAPLPFIFHTEVDLENGHFNLKDRG